MKIRHYLIILVTWLAILFLVSKCMHGQELRLLVKGGPSITVLAPVQEGNYLVRSTAFAIKMEIDGKNYPELRHYSTVDMPLTYLDSSSTRILCDECQYYGIGHGSHSIGLSWISSEQLLALANSRFHLIRAVVNGKNKTMRIKKSSRMEIKEFIK